MEIRFIKSNENATAPQHAHVGDAGADLVAVSKNYDATIDCWIYGTGIKAEIPNTYVGLLFPRSSNRKTDYYMPNHVGVDDSTYRGEIMISFKHRDKLSFIRRLIIKYTGLWIPKAPYEIGDRIAQLVVVKCNKLNFVECDSLSDSERGEGGHGSTGK